jgi:hypothetical protein
MARFLSPEWVEEWNAALDPLVPSDPGPGPGPAVADGHVTVVQEVHGAPDGDVRLVMEVDGGTVRLGLEPTPPVGEDGGRGDAPGPSPDVTIVLSYEDAAAMSRGELSPAEALTAGRIRVRGDLSALAATQQMLNDARSGAAGSIPPTTY